DKAKEIYNQFCRVISEEEIAERIFPEDSLAKLYPERPEPLYNMSNVYFEAKQYKKAIELCDRAIAVDPNFASAYYNKGACLINLRDYNNGCKLIYQAADMGDDMAIQAKPQCDIYYHNK
ncbi:MAG TPA: tetratricopeptide repeat protein, partial [Puia sp.]|nr:tetratricopeptide repeat protein [Puia sp.]